MCDVREEGVPCSQQWGPSEGGGGGVCPPPILQSHNVALYRVTL